MIEPQSATLPLTTGAPQVMAPVAVTVLLPSPTVQTGTAA